MRNFGVVFMFMLILFLVACGGKEIETNMSGKVADFEFTTQDNERLSLNDLKGEWWIADFIFTKCTTVCLPMSSNLASLQLKLKEEDISAQLVSFTVDPDFDTPEVLKEYAEAYGADLSNWSFLTGYDFETIQEISENTFKTVLEEGVVGQRAHGIYFYLIDPDGNIVKKYDGMSEAELDLLVNDFKTVL